MASAIAVESMLRDAPGNTDPDALDAAVRRANEAVIEAARDGRGKPGMGTTMTAATVTGDELVVAQVGDSRAYLLHDGALQRLTRDHSLVAELVQQGRITEEEARYHPQRSVITRALGSDPAMRPDVYSLNIVAGDRLMLCSDGLYSMVDDAKIADIMRTQPDPQGCCDILVNEAISNGGLDNVTVVVVDPLVQGGAPTAQGGAGAADGLGADGAGPAPKKRWRAPLIGIAAVLVVLALAAGGVFAYAQNSWYLIAENGTVVLYRGLPGQIGPLHLSWVEETTDIRTGKLAASTAERLESGVSVGSREEADALLDSYRKTVDAEKKAGGA